MVSSNDVMPLFLQAIMTRRLVTEKTARKLWEKCIEAVNAADETLNIPYHDDREHWDDWVTKVSAALDQLTLEFAHAHDEFSGQHVYGIVNRNGDELAQLATEYTASEIKYFKALIDQIMLSANESYCVSSFVALREVKFVDKTISKTHAEKLLNSFVARGWLVRSRKGRYSLSTRTMLELQNYLRANFDETVHECTICMEMITRGFACSVPNCQTRMHSRCYKTYRTNRNTCPMCKSAWATDNDRTGEKMKKIGEDAFKEGQEKRPRRTRQSDVNEDSEEEDLEEDAENEEPEASQSIPSQTQRGKTQGRRKATVEDEMDVDDEDEEDAAPTRSQARRKSRR